MERNDAGRRPADTPPPAQPEKLFARRIDCGPAADPQPGPPSGRGDGSRRSPRDEAA